MVSQQSSYLYVPCWEWGWTSFPCKRTFEFLPVNSLFMSLLLLEALHILEMLILCITYWIFSPRSPLTFYFAYGIVILFTHMVIELPNFRKLLCLWATEVFCIRNSENHVTNLSHFLPWQKTCLLSNLRSYVDPTSCISEIPPYFIFSNLYLLQSRFLFSISIFQFYISISYKPSQTLR